MGNLIRPCSSLPDLIRACIFPPTSFELAILCYAKSAELFVARGSPERRVGKACAADTYLTYIHILGPGARPIRNGRPGESHEEVPPRDYSLLPRRRPRNSRIPSPHENSAGPRRALGQRKRNRGKEENDIRTHTPRLYPKRRTAYRDCEPRKPQGPILFEQTQGAKWYSSAPKKGPNRRRGLPLMRLVARVSEKNTRRRSLLPVTGRREKYVQCRLDMGGNQRRLPVTGRRVRAEVQ